MGTSLTLDTCKVEYKYSQRSATNARHHCLQCGNEPRVACSMACYKVEMNRLAINECGNEALGYARAQDAPNDGFNQSIESRD